MPEVSSGRSAVSLQRIQWKCQSDLSSSTCRYIFATIADNTTLKKRNRTTILYWTYHLEVGASKQTIIEWQTSCRVALASNTLDKPTWWLYYVLSARNDKASRSLENYSIIKLISPGWTFSKSPRSMYTWLKAEYFREKSTFWRKVFSRQMTVRFRKTYIVGLIFKWHL